MNLQLYKGRNATESGPKQEEEGRGGRRFSAGFRANNICQNNEDTQWIDQNPINWGKALVYNKERK